MQSRRDNDGPNDVAGNEKLEAKQDRAPHILTIKRLIIASPMGAVPQARDKSDSGGHHASRHNEYTHAIHASADHFHDVPKIFHGSVHSRKAGRLSTLFVSNALKTTRSTFARLSFKKYFSNHSREPQCFRRDVRN